LTQLAIVGVFLCLAIGRLFFGVGMNDEGYYAALAYRLSLGQQPLIDTIDLHQSALLVAPYVRAHVALVGDTTGLFIGLRALWMILNLIAAGLWVSALRRVGWGRQSVIPALLAVSFMPFMIPAPSYNTLGIIFTSASLALVAHAVLADRDARWLYAASGASLALAITAYPSLVVLVLVFGLGIWWASRRPIAVLAFVVGGLGVAAAVGVPILVSQPDFSRVLGLQGSMSLLYGWGESSADAIVAKLASGLYTTTRILAMTPGFWLAAIGAAYVIARRRTPSVIWLSLLAVLGAVPLLLRLPPMDVRSSLLVFTTVVSATIAVLPVSADRRATPLWRLLAISAAAGATASGVWALSSTNAPIITLGFGASVALIPMLTALIARVGDRLRSTAGRLAVVLAAGLILVSMTWVNFSATYRDLPPLDLNTMVEAGPHAGLITTRVNAQQCERLWAAMQRLAGAQDRVFAYHVLPGAYLYSSAIPVSRITWVTAYEALGSPEATVEILSSISDRQTAPTIIVKNVGWPDQRWLHHYTVVDYDPERDAVERFVADNYVVVEQDAKWQILVPKGDERVR
jgi:hypothetical protein